MSETGVPPEVRELIDALVRAVRAPLPWPPSLYADGAQERSALEAAIERQLLAWPRGKRLQRRGLLLGSMLLVRSTSHDNVDSH